MDPTITGDQGASIQSSTTIAQATTLDPKGANQNGAVLQIAANLDWLVSNLKAAQTAKEPESTTESSPLSTADLVKILEIALNEIRANQTFVFSVLAFAAAGGAIIQKTHFDGHHKDISPWLWVLGISFCVGAAIWTAFSRHHLTPLGLFVKASNPGEADLVLGDLRSALNKANTAVKKARGPKILLCFGIAIIVVAIGIEFWKCIATPNDQEKNAPAAEQKK